MVVASGYPAERPVVEHRSIDSSNGINIPENSIPDFGPALNAPTIPKNSPPVETFPAPSSSAIQYPSTNDSAMPAYEEAKATEKPVHGWDAVPPPTASSNHGSVPSEAVNIPQGLMPAMPYPSESSQAEAELLPSWTEPEGRPLSPQVAMPIRSDQLESIARQADAEVRHGFELAGRGAYYAARAEFIAALRLIAQGLDGERQTTIHGKSLAAALTALREADDFIPRGSMVEANLDIPSLVVSHQTPVLKNAGTTQITSMSALKSYLTFAQEQLAQAADKEFSGSMALRALGKLYEELAKNQNADFQAASPKAVVFYQAALLVAPNNYMASNDLGVMFARAGNLKDAQAILEHNASISRQSTVLNNLAAVYQKLGRSDWANQAQRDSMLARQMEENRRPSPGQLATGGSVEWVAPDSFAQSQPDQPAPPAMASNPPAPPQPPQTIRAVQPILPATNEYGVNNPHWAPNYPSAAAKKQAPRGEYQR
jgi:tetratricopeptide (TPR) repeat protein